MNTNLKGNIALTKVISDLTEKGFEVFFPLSEHSTVDLVALVDKQPIKLQIKYSSNGIFRKYTIRHGSDGKRYEKFYGIDDFDFYAGYLPTVDKVIYVPLEMGGHEVRSELPDQQASFYWYEDFLTFKVVHNRRKTSEFKKLSFKPRKHLSKMPDKLILEKLVWKKTKEEIAIIYGVSGSIVSRWCKVNDIKCPDRGYWIRGVPKLALTE